MCFECKSETPIKRTFLTDIQQREDKFVGAEKMLIRRRREYGLG